VALLRRAVAAAVRDLTDSDRAVLHIHDLVDVPAQAYLDVPTPAPEDATAA
jgi:hypothetical protein